MGKRFLNSAKNTVLTFAVLHILILIFLASANMNATYLNVFNILDLQLIFPEIDKGLTSTIFSIIITILLFVFYYRKKT